MGSDESPIENPKYKELVAKEAKFIWVAQFGLWGTLPSFIGGVYGFITQSTNTTIVGVGSLILCACVGVGSVRKIFECQGQCESLVSEPYKTKLKKEEQLQP